MKKPVIAAIALAIIGLGAFGWFYTSGPCGTSKVNAALDEMQATFDQFDRAMNVASSTPRMGLPGPIGRMSDIAHDMGELEVPGCMVKARNLMVGAMDAGIDAFLAFMAQDTDSAVNAAFDRAASRTSLATAELERIQGCAPFCSP